MIGDSIIELITPSSGEKTYYRMLNNKQVMSVSYTHLRAHET